MVPHNSKSDLPLAAAVVNQALPDPDLLTNYVLSLELNCLLLCTRLLSTHSSEENSPNRGLGGHSYFKVSSHFALKPI